MTTTATTILNIARSQLGYREGPNNDTKFGRWYGWDNVAYCAIFQSWVFAQAGALNLIYGKHAYCPYWVTDLKANSRWHSWRETPNRGDIVFYSWDGTHGIADHVGIVESYDAANHVVISLEANTTSGLIGDQSDGGGVYRRRRNTMYVAGFGRPAYAPEGSIRPLPPVSRGHDRRPLPLLIDGIWGTWTTTHLQQWLKVPADGVYGPVTRRALQHAVGVPTDGIIGPRTVRALQHTVGARTDGVLGRITVRALQRFLNRAS